MKKKSAWSPPGWPWELELLALIFVITAIAIPGYLQYMQTPAPEEMSLLSQAEAARLQNQGTWQDFTHFFWAVAILGLYIVHLSTAGASSDWISTPFTHLFSPLVFSMITYYRLYKLGGASDRAIQIVTGNPVEILMWVAGILLITFFVARIRMSRHLLNFRNIDWEITTPTVFDKTYVELLAYFRPLVYPPRCYRACEEGILVEGWLYVMPIPFEVINACDLVKRVQLLSSGNYLATSTRSLMRLQLAEHRDPLFISPKDRQAFLDYCERFLAPKRPGTHAGATRSGTRTARVEASKSPAESAAGTDSAATSASE
jgi:hypothetical protein